MAEYVNEGMPALHRCARVKSEAHCSTAAIMALTGPIRSSRGSYRQALAVLSTLRFTFKVRILRLGPFTASDGYRLLHVCDWP
jgi:hypothetical protein